MKRTIPMMLLMLLLLPVGCKKLAGGPEKISWPDNPAHKNNQRILKDIGSFSG